MEATGAPMGLRTLAALVASAVLHGVAALAAATLGRAPAPPPLAVLVDLADQPVTAADSRAPGPDPRPPSARPAGSPGFPLPSPAPARGADPEPPPPMAPAATGPGDPMAPAGGPAPVPAVARPAAVALEDRGPPPTPSPAGPPVEDGDPGASGAAAAPVADLAARDAVAEGVWTPRSRAEPAAREGGRDAGAPAAPSIASPSPSASAARSSAASSGARALSDSFAMLDAAAPSGSALPPGSTVPSGFSGSPEAGREARAGPLGGPETAASSQGPASAATAVAGNPRGPAGAGGKPAPGPAEGERSPAAASHGWPGQADGRAGARTAGAAGRPGGPAAAGGLALAIGGGSGSDQAAEYGPYLRALRTLIQNAVRYPAVARRRGLSGTVHLELLIEPDAGIRAVAVVGSSSHAALDRAALESVRSLRPPPYPAGAPRRPLRVRVPVVFELR